MIVISDTSAITSLAAIGHLFLLQELYQTVIIPETVYQELFGPPVSAGAQEAKNYDWIQIKTIEKSRANELLLITLNNDRNYSGLILHERNGVVRRNDDSV